MAEYKMKQQNRFKTSLQARSSNKKLHFKDNRLSNIKQIQLVNTITHQSPNIAFQLKDDYTIQRMTLYRAGNTKPRVEYENIGTFPLIRGNASNKDITAQIIVNGTEGLSTFDSEEHLNSAGLHGPVKHADISSGNIYDVISDGGTGTKPVGHVTIAPHQTQFLSVWTQALNNIEWAL